ncbi:hypothetical protein [Ruegeria sp. HKCCD8929]|uniref:hypothetical protein n=1 Tax=Ruegeria sp. HKCCD8929 TaxID=2683006 RepID=UPI001488481B|nr:hypothetical protein [Ruegeria sp. HKCCD8929]
MKRPLSMWIAAGFAGLVSLSLMGNVVGLVLGQLNPVEQAARPATFLVVSAVGGVLHFLWARAAWRVSERALQHAGLCMFYLAIVLLLFWIAPSLLFEQAMENLIQVQPLNVALWLAIYAVMIALTLHLKRAGKLRQTIPMRNKEH